MGSSSLDDGGFVLTSRDSIFTDLRGRFRLRCLDRFYGLVNDTLVSNSNRSSAICSVCAVIIDRVTSRQSWLNGVPALSRLQVKRNRMNYSASELYALSSSSSTELRFM